MHQQKSLLILSLMFALPTQAADKLHLDFELSAMHDDNVNRAEHSRDIKSDSILSSSLNLIDIHQLSEKSGVSLRGGLKQNEFAHFDQMSNLQISLETIYLYQPISSFSAPVIEATLGVDRFQFRGSELRDGYQAHTGLGLSSRLTDKLKLRFTAEYERRWADEQSVFDWNHFNLIAGAEYRLSRGRLYLDYVNTMGDQVFSSTPNLSIRHHAQAFADDDVFAGKRAYRLGAIARQFNLGYQWPLNPRNTLDIGMKLIDISADGSNEYQDQQIRLSWLYRFF